MGPYTHESNVQWKIKELKFPSAQCHNEFFFVCLLIHIIYNI